MKKKHFLQGEHKTGITAVICLLIGALAAVMYLYLSNNTVFIIKDNSSFQSENTNKNNSKYNSAKQKYNSKRYNIFNYYYSDKNSKPKTQVIHTDTLPDTYNEGFYKIDKTSADDIILDLNSCDTLDLQMLRGIGPVYSRRICNYRNKLGGYVALNQLKEVYGMTDTLYKKIKPHFIVKNSEPYRKINVNSQNIKELASHPYIDWYLAKEIILFRNNHGEIKDINMLKAVHLMNDSLFEKLRPYMDIK